MNNLSENLKAEIIAHIEKHQPEIYWDQNSELSETQIEKILSEENGQNDVENELDEMNWEYRNDLIKEAIKEYGNDFEEKISAELQCEKEDWEDDFKEWAEDFTYCNTNLKDLLRNTSDQVFFYDMGMDIDGYGSTPAEFRMQRIKIKKALSITDNRFDDNLDDMVQQASYGGKLVVYFTSGIDELLDAMNNESTANTIRFKNAYIAVIHIGNGSGGECQIPKHEFSLPFNKSNIFYERSIKYNYTYAVCGMSSDWCDSTQFSFHTKADAVEAVKSDISASKEQDKQYKITYQSGKCTFGDSDIKRHRKVTYINNFPCGSKCLNCGQFWID
jgi:hypothetical protein